MEGGNAKYVKTGRHIYRAMEFIKCCVFLAKSE